MLSELASDGQITWQNNISWNCIQCFFTYFTLWAGNTRDLQKVSALLYFRGKRWGRE